MKKKSVINGVLTIAVVVWLALGASAALAADVTLSEFIGGPAFNNPIGIDFHEPNGGNLISSVHWPTGSPNNLQLIDVSSATATPFSTLNGLTDELKIATARNSVCQQFPIGDVFTANGQPGEIVRLDKNGNIYSPAANNPGVAGSPGGIPHNSWVKLPGEPELLRGSLFVDRFCAFGGDVIVVTGNGTEIGGGDVWRVKANGTAQLLASIKNPDTGIGAHLEGVITLPNDLKYGPWAGTIIAGDENFNADMTKNGRIWSITAAGVATPYTLAYTDPLTGVHHPIKPEDLDLIEAGGDFFGVNFSDGRILTAPGTDFTKFVGDILVTQEYPCGSNQASPNCSGAGSTTATTGLYVVHWNGTAFQVTELKFSATSAAQKINQWEHVTFAPKGDVEVHKCAGSSVNPCNPSATINVGDIATYNIVVIANGPSASFDVKLTDTVPTGVDANGWSVTVLPITDQSKCSNPVAGGATLTCNFGTMQPGDQKQITLTAKTTSGACPSIKNTATITSINDSNSSNNSSGPVTINVKCPPPPQLAVVKTPDGGTFNQGDQVSFTIVVSNPAPTGAGAATNVVLTDTLPTAGGLSWATVTTTQGSCTLSGTNNQSLNCSLGTIAAQKSVSIVVTSTKNTPNTACTLQDNPVAIAKADGGLQAQDSGFLVCVPPTTGARITGGGSVFFTDAAGQQVRVTHGFQLHCDISSKQSNNLEINWGGGNNFHLDTLTSVQCIIDPTINPPPPPSTSGGPNTYIATATGTCNKKPATIAFTLTDAGEPGTLDTAAYSITGAACSLSVTKTKLTFGNHQFHAK